jgi:F0F1-type ATP synthase membrane subunit b/b'
MFYFIVAVIIAWLLYRAFSTNVSDDKIETVILVCAIIILIYHFLLKHILDSLDSASNYVKGGIKSLNL